MPLLLIHGSRDKTVNVFGDGALGYDDGHLDIVFGHRAPRDVWPAIKARKSKTKEPTCVR